MYVKTQLFIIVIIYTSHMINVPVQILFSSNKKVNENRQQLIEKMSEKETNSRQTFFVEKWLQDP